MKQIYQWLVCTVFLVQAIYSYAEHSTLNDQGKNNSFTTLNDVKEYLDKRGFIETRKRDGVLKFAGDVRAKWVFSREDLSNASVDKYTPLPQNRYRSEFHLYIDYAADRSWLTSIMSWAAIAGGESTAAGVDIDRAFLGYSLYKNPATKTDFFVEIGRSSLGSLFESEVQFSSNFDGVHFYYSRRFSKKLPYQMIFHGGPFVVNMTKKHYAWAAEGILSNLPKQFVIKCSVVDWNSFTPSEMSAPDNLLSKTKYKYYVLQSLIGKHSKLPWLNGTKKPLYLYGAVLTNTLAKPSATTLNEKQNFGWFVGGTLGGLKKAGDWSATIRYEYVEALAIPEIDISGIGRGNALKFWFAQALAGNYDPKEANGFANYKGVSCLFMYSLTDSLSFRGYGAFSRPADNRLGSDFSYRKFDLGLISAF
nr:hypothetical protein [Chlamydia sp. 17-3921]